MAVPQAAAQQPARPPRRCIGATILLHHLQRAALHTRHPGGGCSPRLLAQEALVGQRHDSDLGLSQRWKVEHRIDL
jgi:hypothetical protein